MEDKRDKRIGCTAGDINESIRQVEIGDIVEGKNTQETQEIDINNDTRESFT